MVSATHLQPNKFSGEVTLNGVPAPLNTTINAFIDGVHKGSITVEIAGKYGDFDGLKYLDVSGDDSDDGKTINFTIDGIAAERTAVWIAYEHPRVLDLSAVGTPTGDAPPTISITSPSSDQTFDAADITVNGSASDNADVASVEVKLGSGSWTSATGTDSWNKDVTLNLGPNTIHARATDTSGLTAETSITVVYNPPDSTGETGSPGGNTGGSVLSSGATPTGTDTQPASGEGVTSATSTPTMTGTAAPAATSAKESSAEPEEKKGQVPGFEAMFAIAGLLAVAYLIRRE